MTSSRALPTQHKCRTPCTIPFSSSRRVLPVPQLAVQMPLQLQLLLLLQRCAPFFYAFERTPCTIPFSSSRTGRVLPVPQLAVLVLLQPPHLSPRRCAPCFPLSISHPLYDSLSCLAQDFDGTPAGGAGAATARSAAALPPHNPRIAPLILTGPLQTAMLVLLQPPPLSPGVLLLPNAL
jgi:hypothetical protein